MIFNGWLKPDFTTVHDNFKQGSERKESAMHDLPII